VSFRCCAREFVECAIKNRQCCLGRITDSLMHNNLTPQPTDEVVILADDNGQPAGTENKVVVHTAETPLHFAFSAWLVRDGKLLLTRRALTKQTWPGVWTNSFCGHPAPGESNADAVYRRAVVELGIDPSDLSAPEVVLPDFAYRAVDSSGIVENEICPVFITSLNADATFEHNPEEVDSLAWVEIEKVLAAV